MATFFPTGAEWRAAVRWLRRHPLVAAAAAAVAVASIVHAVRSDGGPDDNNNNKGGDTDTSSTSTPHDGRVLERTVSWSDDCGRALTQVMNAPSETATTNGTAANAAGRPPLHGASSTSSMNGTTASQQKVQLPLPTLVASAPLSILAAHARRFVHAVAE